MNGIKHSFLEVYKQAQKGAVGANFHEKMLNGRWDRVYPAIQKIKNISNLKRGIDFGCAHGGMSVLGKMSNIHIVGVDVPDSPYNILQNNLIQMGYPIKIIDTLEFPWPFKDNEFDFITIFSSITRGCQSCLEGSNLRYDWEYNWNKCECMNRRIEEISRIIKCNGYVYVKPKGYREIVKKSKALSKKKKFRIL